MSHYESTLISAAKRIESLEAQVAKLKLDLRIITESDSDWRTNYSTIADNNLFLRDQVSKLKEGLKKIKYGYHVVRGDGHSGKLCIVCGEFYAEGCNPDCWLDALIKS